MKLSVIRNMAKRNTLEVEHLLRAAKARTVGLRNELDLLSRELGWSDTPYPSPGVHVVPLARWALIVGTYADEGFSGLLPLASDGQNASYILAVIEEVKNEEAAISMVAFFRNILLDPSINMETARHVASACNVLFSLKGGPAPTDDQAKMVQRFLILFYERAETLADKALSIYALRGIGNAQALAFISAVPEFREPYVGANKIAVRAIKKRLAGNAL
jgi:hypothetical protein